ncbi:MAG: thiamine pyrophosphate-binding protein [Dehalococcoidales bacterium]|jgi:acetolactate synthase-1/2/3 large subunit|nr:thiamine pyrophosphate-binding protein [Dehalococcoidales bacterium]
MSEMTGAEALIESLSHHEVEVIFGIPGVQIMELLDTFYRNRKVRWVTVRHEQTAAYMAFGYARSTGKVGVAMVVPGPGALNSCAAIGTAYAASTPVLLLAGQIDRQNLGKNRGMLHEVTEQMDVFRPITKWNGRITEVSDIPATLQFAMGKLKTGRPRPVEIEIPFDLWGSTGSVQFDKVASSPPRPVDRAKIREVVSMMTNAERPVIWAGGGIITGNAAGELREFAERINSPVVMTAEGKGSISADHPLASGDANFHSNPVLSMADLIVCLGSRFFPRQRVRSDATGPKVIQIDIDDKEIGRNWNVDLGIVADVRPSLAALLEELPESNKGQWETAEIERINAAWRTEMEEAAPIQTSALRDIRDELEEDGILVCGVTNVGYWSQLYYPVYKPRTFLTSSYFVTLGYVFPTALGAKVGNPDRQVVAISGDGGFLFAAGDLATAVQQKLNVVTIIFNDGTYGATYRIQQRNYENRIIGTELKNPDFAALAESFGARGIKLTDHKELKGALRSAFAENGPVVIEVPVPNMVLPWEVI